MYLIYDQYGRRPGEGRKNTLITFTEYYGVVVRTGLFTYYEAPALFL